MTAAQLAAQRAEYDAHQAAWAHVGAFKYYRKRGDTAATVLRDLELLDNATDSARRKIVADMREDGCSWVEVGEALGISRQTAWERYGPGRPDRDRGNTHH